MPWLTDSPSAPAWLVDAVEPTEGESLRALTVKGELADALVDGVKACENRSWPIPRGALLIHKGLAATPKEWVKLVKRAARGPPLPKGHIVGAVYIDRTTTLAEARGEPFEEWAAGPLVHVVKHSYKFARPVPHNGALSRWRVNQAALAAIREQLATAPAKDVVRAAQLGLRARGKR